MTTPVYEESADVPAGRRSRTVAPELWARLADSAKRGVAFSVKGAEALIDELRRDLSSAAVKAKYEVVTSTAKMEGGVHKITFAATAKPTAKAVK